MSAAVRGAAGLVVVGLGLLVWTLLRRGSAGSVAITESGLGSMDGETWFSDADAVTAGPRSVLEEIIVSVQKIPETVAGAVGPLGVRQKNPMHVRATATTWQGEVPGPGGYEWFADDESGIRAGARVLLNYQRLHGLRTVREWITRYAPHADNNPTDAYIRNVAAWLNVGADDRLDLESQPLMRRLVRAVIRQEVGGSWSAIYSDELIARAVERAYT